ncbi:zinc metalloproteinase dpy-31-like [Saccostrea cucullata]|uniref:zinc metalloproteinase dpy-31-like n=1 Tax=Saccostrea cuccullata TaxID=36930 RepID=UPI002ED37F63
MTMKLVAKAAVKQKKALNERKNFLNLKANIALINKCLKIVFNKVTHLKKRIKRSFKGTDMIDGDIKLDKDSAANLVAFYKRNPQYLRLDNTKADTPAFSSSDRRKRKVGKVGKWSFPIEYKLQLSKKRRLVRKALKIWQQETCVSFRETGAITTPGIIFKENEEWCWSNVGRKSSGYNEINLENGCKSLGTILHEIGHALGMWHEQSRPDRDNHITILEDNIKSGKKHNFLVRPGDTYGTQYDYGSIMHYSERAFANKGQKTIIAKQRDYEKTMGQRTGLSFNDIKAINFHYCQGSCFGGLTWSSYRNGGYRDPRSCGRCKCPEGWTGTYCQYLKKSTTGCGCTNRSAKSYYKYLNTPGYFRPEIYPTNSECTWKITAPAGKRIRFEFVWYFILSCYTLCLDFVEVRYNSLSNTGPR